MNNSLDEPIKKLLSHYLQGMESGNLTPQELIILNEFFIKDNTLKNNNDSEISEQDMLKYAFLGYWIYKELGRT